MNSLPKEFYGSFIRVNGYVLSALGFIISFFPFYFSYDDSIKVKFLLPGICVIILSIIILIDVSIRSIHASNNLLPKVLDVRIVNSGLNEPKILILLDRSNIFFGDNAVVSVYVLENSWEILIGIGHVQTVRQDKMIQIEVIKREEGKEGAWQAILDNPGVFRKNMVVKPEIRFRELLRMESINGI